MAGKEAVEAVHILGRDSKGGALAGPAGQGAARGTQPTAAVQLEGVSKSFGAVVALQNVNLELRRGTLTSLLGPSGCGKTTLLRLIAGLDEPSVGQIVINGRSVDQVPIHKRNIGLVFQNYALFPHKGVGDNIAFGLRHRGVPRELAKEKVRKALEMVRLPGIEDRYPNQLSGGQQQRVALARAVVFEPDVLLLDEPLSALDANLREEMRVEIKLIQKALGLTTVMVTHDQQEALAMSDEVVVLDHGVVQQIGTPETVYRYPRNRFVAGFLGQANILACEVQSAVGSGHKGARKYMLRISDTMSLEGVAGGHPEPYDLHPGTRANLVVRASDVLVERYDKSAFSGNRLAGRVVDSSYLGDFVQYLLEVDGLRLQAMCRVGGATGEAHVVFAAGTEVSVYMPAESATVLPDN